jgi:cytochrome c2
MASQRTIWAVFALLALWLLVACSSGDKTQTNTVDSIVARGERLFRQNCATCHSTEPDTVIVGPSLAGVATRAETRIGDLSAKEYIHQSIVKPSAYVVDGFADLMPTRFGTSLSGEQLDALIAYLLTLK